MTWRTSPRLLGARSSATPELIPMPAHHLRAGSVLHEHSQPGHLHASKPKPSSPPSQIAQKRRNPGALAPGILAPVLNEQPQAKAPIERNRRDRPTSHP